MPIFQPPAAGGGGGGGETLTEEVVAAPTGGQVVVVTHPEVPLEGEGSGRIRFSGLAEVPGGAVSYYFAGPWGDQNLNVNGAAWVQDSGNDGHFSVDPGPQVVVGVRVIPVESFPCDISTINDPDLTASGAVTLNGPMASGPIVRIAGTLGNDNKVVSPAHCDFTGQPMPYSISPVIVTEENLADLGTFQEQYTWGSEEPTKVRAALSIDDGGTWYSHDGTGWKVIALADLRTAGLVPNAAGMAGGFYDSRAAPLAEMLDSADWHELYLLGVAAGEGFALRMAVGIDVAGGVDEVAIWQLEFRAQEQDTFQPMAVATMGAGFTSIKRTSSTTTAFEISLGWAASPVNWRCQVWTS